jgi:hypothetical protein
LRLLKFVNIFFPILTSLFKMNPQLGAAVRSGIGQQVLNAGLNSALGGGNGNGAAGTQQQQSAGGGGNMATAMLGEAAGSVKFHFFLVFAKN